jgi:type IV secretory pathway VirB6-like protein
MLKLILFVLDMIINFVYRAVMSTARSACFFPATLYVGVAISRYISGTSEQNSDVGFVGAVLSSTVGENGCRLEFVIKRHYIYDFF